MTKSSSQERAAKCLAAALAVEWTADGGSVRGCAEELAKKPEGGWPETEQSRAALREAIVCAARRSNDDTDYTDEEIDIACKMALAASSGAAEYLVIAAPGHYTSMDLVRPVRTYRKPGPALRYARDRPGVAVIRIETDTQSPPWLGHDLDRLHREQSVSTTSEAGER